MDLGIDLMGLVISLREVIEDEAGKKKHGEGYTNKKQPKQWSILLTNNTQH